MPNHVTNIVNFSGNDAVKATLALSEDETFKFGFFPMPEELRGTSSPTRIATEAEIAEEIKRYDAQSEDYKKMVGRSFSITQEQSAELIKKYGCNNWYDWAYNNWGTKWAGYDGEMETPTRCKFQTAWSTPYPALKRLSELFPETTIRVAYADEDFGSNTGTYELLGGVSIAENVMEYGVESLNHAYTVMGENEYQLDYVLEDYEDDNESEQRFSEDCENEYNAWAIDKMVEESYLPSEDLPRFINEYLRGKAVDAENFEFAGEIKRIIDLKLAQSN